MNVAEITPVAGKPQGIYCTKCKTHAELAFADFSEKVSGVAISISGLPILQCPACGNEQLPDPSKFLIVELHMECVKRGSPGVRVTRNKRTDDFGRAKVDFLYDPDDYFYIPGLYRSFDEGFLQPVFFRREVLFKYDNMPGYSITFASTTYGTINTTDSYISFGVNRRGHVVMWLGDIATLPDTEQYHLRSENVPSDHALGSEFYDGQIEIVYTQQTKENELFRLRSEFLGKAQKRFGMSLGHLEAEAFDLALAFTPPVVDTP
jgi:hypothetical protein